MKKLILFFTVLTLSVGLWAEAPANVEYVDLGLPSGTKWATMNVGATTPEGYGDYFAWGETEPYYADTTANPVTWKTDKSNGYAWSSYFDTSDGGETFQKYNHDSGKTVLDATDDAATANWGSNWRMPTKAEIDELVDECTWTWTTNYNGTGIKGCIVTSKAEGNTNSIFLPASSCFIDLKITMVGSFGFYWSSSLDEEDLKEGSCIAFNKDRQDKIKYPRCYGYTVRPVYVLTDHTALESVDDAQDMHVSKFMQNGQLIIRKGNKKYNVLGAEL